MGKCFIGICILTYSYILPFKSFGSARYFTIFEIILSSLDLFDLKYCKKKTEILVYYNLK